jgi:hypothetical protein
MRECFAELEIWPETVQRNADARSMRSIANGLEPATFSCHFSGAAPSKKTRCVHIRCMSAKPPKIQTAPLLC